MTDFSPFEDLLRGHAGLLEDTTHDRWLRAQMLFEERSYREAAVLLTELLDDPGDPGRGTAPADPRPGRRAERRRPTGGSPDLPALAPRHPPGAEAVPDQVERRAAPLNPSLPSRKRANGARNASHVRGVDRGTIDVMR